MIYKFRDQSLGTQARSAGNQAAYQAAAMFTSLGIGILGGAITAGFLKLTSLLFNYSLDDSDFFLDTPYWHELPVDYPGRKRPRREKESDPESADKNEDAKPVVTTVRISTEDSDIIRTDKEEDK